MEAELFVKQVSVRERVRADALMAEFSLEIHTAGHRCLVGMQGSEK